ncbi:MAG: dTMP kinase [Mycobacteriales bacterium]
MSTDQELLARLPEQERAAHGVPDPRRGAARARAVQLLETACADLLQDGGVRCSPLGPEWGGDVDVHVRRLPAPARLRALGWLPLDPLLERVGSTGGCRWAVVEDGEVLACADFHLTLVPDPVRAVLARCTDRGEVRLREVLELRALLAAGAALPRSPVVAAAARVEQHHGGSALLAWRDGLPEAGPARLLRGRLLAPWRRVRRLRRPRFVVAVSGVDGAGKSTLVRGLEERLRTAAVPVEVIWARPGMTMAGGVYRVAVVVKRLFRQEPVPGVRAVAAGTGQGLRSRRGLVGWAWVVTVTVVYLLDVRRQHLRARGVVLYDRHLYDALATLDFAYEGVDLRVPRALVTRLLPRADLTVYLDLPTGLAVSRKPDDPFGELAVDRQLRSYGVWRDRIRRLVVLDASGSREQVAQQALAALLDPAAAAAPAALDRGLSA